MSKLVKITIMFFVAVLCILLFVSCDAGDSMYNDTIKSDDYIENGIIVDGISGGESTGNLTSSPSLDNNDKESEFETKIIKRYNLETETKTFDASIASIEHLIKTTDSYIESSSTTGNSIYNNTRTQRVAKYVVRVPADKVEDFVKNTTSLLNVLSSNSTAQNVTSAYYDLQSRYDVLEAEKTALNSMLEEATTVDTMLRIRDQLNDVISEMESIKTQLKLYDSLVLYSTVTLKITEVVEYTVIDTDEPSWGKRMVDAFKESWADFANNFKDFTVWLVYAFPTILVLGILGTGVGFALHFSNKRSKKKWEERRKSLENKKSLEEKSEQ